MSITPLILKQLPIDRVGLTEFTFSRYLPPLLCDYEGQSLFIDADMVCLGDIAELFDLADDNYAVQVSKNPLRFEWPSVMLFNNEKCRALTTDYIEKGNPQAMEWGVVGELPGAWNHLVGYDQERDDAQMVHYTQGIPCLEEVKGCEYSQEWLNEYNEAVYTVPWSEIMGGSVHAEPVLRRLNSGNVEIVN